MSKKELMTSYEHIQCGVNSNNTPVSFIQKWTSCNDNINKKDSMQIYPNPDKCPDNVFNLWRPFAMEILTSPYQKHTEGLDMMLKHILVLCDNDKKVFDYFIGWIAMMIQKPEIKTTCITLISKEGAGKGTLMQLFAKMLGESKILETKTPSRDVWGQFNGIMADAFLVNLNEMEYKETMNAEGQIKALITDTQMTISKKGTNQFSVNSYHHFIITTNKENPIATTKDDRRKLIIRSSDQFIGNREYFNQMYALLDDVEFVRTCYDYFKTYDLSGYEYKDIPRTEHQEDLQMLSTSAPEQWLESFTMDYINETTVKRSSSEVYNMFLDWCGANNVKYDTTSLKFAVNLKNLKIPGVEKGGHTKKCVMKSFNIGLLKNHFNLDC
jgi:putative DNA primase/helicase